MLATLTALFIHRVREELRKLDKAATVADSGLPAYDPASTTAGTAERAPQWDHDTKPPVSARTGFTARRQG